MRTRLGNSVLRAEPAPAPDLLFRSMSAGDIEAGLALCRASNWNQIEGDWNVFLQSNPAGCRVAVRDGRVIGTVATLRYGDDFSWLSMVLVDPAERGSGIGTLLLHEGLEVLRDETCVRLDATPAGRQIYSRHGFAEEYVLSRLTATAAARTVSVVERSVRPVCERDLDQILRLDELTFGADRGALLRALLRVAPSYAWVAAQGARIQGYMFGRPGFRYDHLGPVVASSQSIAEDLVAQCLSVHDKEDFVIDVPRSKLSWHSWLSAAGFGEERSYIRMSRGEPHRPGDAARQFAILGPEFG